MLNPIDKINKSYLFIFYLVPGLGQVILFPYSGSSPPRILGISEKKIKKIKKNKINKIPLVRHSWTHGTGLIKQKSWCRTAPSLGKHVVANFLGLFFKVILFLENNERVRFK